MYGVKDYFYEEIRKVDFPNFDSHHEIRNMKLYATNFIRSFALMREQWNILL